MLKNLKVKFDLIKPAWVKERGLSSSPLNNLLELTMARAKTCTTFLIGKDVKPSGKTLNQPARNQGSNAGGSWFEPPQLFSS